MAVKSIICFFNKVRGSETTFLLLGGFKIMQVKCEAKGWRDIGVNKWHSCYYILIFFFNALWLNRSTQHSRLASCKLYPQCAWSLGKWRQEDGKLQASLDYITSSSRTGWGGVEKSSSFTEKNGVLGLLSSSNSPVYLDPFLRGNHCCHGVQLFSDLSSNSPHRHTHTAPLLPPPPPILDIIYWFSL